MERKFLGSSIILEMRFWYRRSITLCIHTIITHAKNGSWFDEIVLTVTTVHNIQVAHTSSRFLWKKLLFYWFIVAYRSLKCFFFGFGVVCRVLLATAVVYKNGFDSAHIKKSLGGRHYATRAHIRIYGWHTCHGGRNRGSHILSSNRGGYWKPCHIASRACS